MLGKMPLYQQLIEELAKYISDEKLLPGDQILTEPEISQKYGVSRATVRQAIQELVNAGVLVKIHGKGTFLAEPKVKMNVKAACLRRRRQCDLFKSPSLFGWKAGFD